MHTFDDRNFTSGFLHTWNLMLLPRNMSLPLSVRTHTGRRQYFGSSNMDRKAEGTQGPLFFLLWPDTEISKTYL